VNENEEDDLMLDALLLDGLLDLDLEEEDELLLEKDELQNGLLLDELWLEE